MRAVDVAILGALTEWKKAECGEKTSWLVVGFSLIAVTRGCFVSAAPAAAAAADDDDEEEEEEIDDCKILPP